MAREDNCECECNVRLKNIIDEFPEELLLKIFGFLKSVKNLTLVNKKFQEIVTHNFSTMKKLPLIIRGDLRRKDHLTIGNWNFYKVVFKIIKESFNPEMLSSLKSIGSNIREIEFNGCYFSEPKVFQDILGNFPKVEKLMFENCYFRRINRVQESDTNVLELENLNEIVLDQRCLMVFGCIGAQLKSLIINMPGDFVREASGGVFKDQQQLMNFLYTQNRLESLALINVHALTQVFARKENSEFQFKLKKLSLHRINYEEGFNYNNMKGFLNTQKDSVEILELGTTSSKDVYKLILNQFENVKTLCIDISNFPTGLKRININKSVTNLILDGNIVDSVQYCKFLSLFPNVTDIRFSYEIDFKMLSWLSNCCKNITSISLIGLSRGKYQNLKFSALKTIHLECIENNHEKELSDLVMSNRTIESLSIRSISRSYTLDPKDYFVKKLMMICEVLPNLKHLKLGGNIRVNMCDLQKIVEMCKNLESIDVIGDEVGIIPMRRGLTFRCHDFSTVRYVFRTHLKAWEDDMTNKNFFDYYNYKLRGGAFQL